MAGFGGESAHAPTVPVGTPGQDHLRQFSSVNQTIAANNVPAVGALSGADGAFIEPGLTNGSQGYVVINAGATPGSGGSVALVFPNTPPSLFIAGSPDQFGTLSQVTVSDTVTISWTGTMQKNTRARISFQWATSR